MTSVPPDQLDAKETGPSLSAQLRNWGRTCAGTEFRAELGAAAVYTPIQRLGLFLCFALLLMLRLPSAWLAGRLLCEEGTIFLAYAWHFPAGEALLRPFGGYLNLAANATGLAIAKLVRANLMPLEMAPRFSMAVAMVFQLLPGLLLLTARARWLANRWAVIGSLLFVATSPMTEEVFANTLHIQFHLALCCGLILAMDIPPSRGARAGYLAILLLAPLCGPGAIVFAPLFVLRTIMDRSASRLMQALALSAGSAVQLILFYSTSPVRGHLLDPLTLANLLFVRLVAMPLVTAPAAKILGVGVFHLDADGIGWWFVAALSATCFTWLGVTALRKPGDGAFWLLAAGMASAVVIFGAGGQVIDRVQLFVVSSAERYNFLPLAMLGMGMIALVIRGDLRYQRVCMAICCLGLISGAVTFFSPIRMMASGPDWKSEVQAWRRDHDHKLATWPADWLVDLSDHDQACPLPGSAGKGENDPSYCESNWVAMVKRKAAR